MKPKKLLDDKQQMVEDIMGRICVLQEHIYNLEVATSYLMQGGRKAIDAGEIRSELVEKELEAWRQLCMWGLVVDRKTKDRIKAAVHQRFLSKDMSVGYWLNNGVKPLMWLGADEKKFRDMCKHAFLEEEKE